MKKIQITKEEAKTVSEALDTLALVLADYNHQWTPKERRAYERAVKVMTKVTEE